MIGRRGILGLPVAIGTDEFIFSSAPVIPGAALRLDAATLRHVLAAQPVEREVFARHTAALLYQVGQLSACHARCEVRQRVASWLLRAADEVVSCRLRVTHEVIALCLAIRRASVSGVIEELAREGLVAQGRGMIELVDPRDARHVACDCHRLIRAHYRQMEVELRSIRAGPFDPGPACLDTWSNRF